MTAQLSHSEPCGKPASSSSGVRSAGSLARNSGVPLWPHMSTSSNSRPAARTKTRAVRLLTLGLRMLRVFAAISLSSSPLRDSLVPVGLLRRAVGGQRTARALDQRLDGIGEVDLIDVVVAAGDSDLVRLEQDIDVVVAGRRLEAIRRELDQETEGVLEIDRVHEAAVLDAAMPYPPLLEPLDGLVEARLRHRERDVVHASGIGGRALRIRRALVVREHRDQSPIPGIEVEVALARPIEVRLLEHERHA